MTHKNFTFDLGKIMDEALKVAQKFSDAFERGMEEGKEHAEEFARKFHWRDFTDFYPYYSYPPANIYLTKEKNLIFEFALAGFEEKDINLQFRVDYLCLTVKATAESKEEPGLQYFKKKLKLRDIDDQRYYAPADKFDHEKVEARYRNGLLRVLVPAREDIPEEQGVRINIKSEEKKEKTS